MKFDSLQNSKLEFLCRYLQHLSSPSAPDLVCHHVHLFPILCDLSITVTATFHGLCPYEAFLLGSFSSGDPHDNGNEWAKVFWLSLHLCHPREGKT